MKIVTCRAAHTAVAMLGILLHEAVKAHVLHVSSRRLNGIRMVPLYLLKCLTERVFRGRSRQPYDVGRIYLRHLAQRGTSVFPEFQFECFHQRAVDMTQ